jgi:hypothetical protein
MSRLGMEEVCDWRIAKNPQLLLVLLKICLIVVSSKHYRTWRIARKNRIPAFLPMIAQRMRKGSNPPISMTSGRFLAIELRVEQVHGAFEVKSPVRSAGMLAHLPNVALAVSDKIHYQIGPNEECWTTKK